MRGELPVRVGVKGYGGRYGSIIENVVIHYTGIDTDTRVEDTALWQTGKDHGTLFPEIAYRWYVRRDGTLYLCHDTETVAWHCGAGSNWYLTDCNGYSVGKNNWESVGVCFTGLYPTDAQIAGMRRAIDHDNALLGRELIVMPHKVISKRLTECPGDYGKWFGRLLEK